MKRSRKKKASNRKNTQASSLYAEHQIMDIPSAALAIQSMGASRPATVEPVIRLAIHASNERFTACVRKVHTRKGHTSRPNTDANVRKYSRSLMVRMIPCACGLNKIPQMSRGD